jgi:hypothetical protein
MLIISKLIEGYTSSGGEYYPLPLLFNESQTVNVSEFDALDAIIATLSHVQPTHPHHTNGSLTAHSVRQHSKWQRSIEVTHASIMCYVLSSLHVHRLLLFTATLNPFHKHNFIADGASGVMLVKRRSSSLPRAIVNSLNNNQQNRNQSNVNPHTLIPISEQQTNSFPVGNKLPLFHIRRQQQQSGIPLAVKPPTPPQQQVSTPKRPLTVRHPSPFGAKEKKATQV